MSAEPSIAHRLRGLPTARVLGRQVAVADRFVPRLLGLALLRAELAGAGLLIPRCRSVHTFGMRFAIDVLFLDARGRVLERRAALGPCRFAGHAGAAAVLEMPARRDDAERGGEKRPSRPQPPACSPKVKR